MDLTRTENWQLVGSFTQVVEYKTQPRPGYEYEYKPLNPVSFATASNFLVVVVNSTVRVKDTWQLGAWAKLYRQILGRETKLGSQRCQLNGSTLLDFPAYENIATYNLVLEFPYWLEDVSGEVYQFQPEQTQTKNTFFLGLDNPTYTRDPERPTLWISRFDQDVVAQGKPLAAFEVGRFYDAATDVIVGDPIILQANNGKLICYFTGEQPVNVNAIKVRIIY